MNMEQVSSHNKFIKGFTQLLKDTKPIIVSSTIWPLQQVYFSVSVVSGALISSSNRFIIFIYLTTNIYYIRLIYKTQCWTLGLQINRKIYDLVVCSELTQLS